jgi:uncharacterized protein DUF5916/cellulose/xylan binding protein with CBM9 domain
MKLRALVFALFLCSSSASGQSTQSAVRAPDAGKESSKAALSKTVTLPPEKAKPVTIRRFEKPPVIDGKLDGDEWKTAVVLSDFYQTQPGDNTAPSFPTQVFIGYDSKNFYLAFRAKDEPDKVRAQVAKRDEIWDGDTVHVLIDTFNDKRKAYLLGFNPLGIQSDGIFREGEGDDFSLDIVMESKGSLTEDGYVVEVAIPFKSLRYEAGQGRLWGFNAVRRIRRLDNEYDSWMPRSRDKSGVLNQQGYITGLEGISTERTLEIIPTLTLSESGRRVRTLSVAAVDADPTLRDPGRFVNKPVKADPGLNVKLGLTSTVTLDFTVNPDFAQVEADQPVVVANQRFPIFFSEKRPFFLEGADIFQTPLQAVHTRTIIDPDAAMKLSGKQGRNSFGVLLASDNAPGDFTEEERNDPAIFADIARFIDKNAYVGILRYKRDVGKENAVGLIATSYNFIEKHNQLGGLDGRFRLDQQSTFSFQVLGTTSRRFFFEPELNDSVYRTGNAVGYYWNYDKFGRHFGYQIQGQGRTRDYRADVGFTRRTNTNYQGNFFRYNSEPKPKAKLISWRLIGGTDTNFDWQGRMQNIGGFTNIGFDLTRQTFFNIGYNDFYERLFEEEFGAKRTATQEGAFFGDSERSTRGRSVSSFFNTNFSKKFSAAFFAGHRWNVFDFDFGAGPRFPRVSPAALVNPDAPLDPGPANTFDLSASVEYKPTPPFRVSLDYNRNRFTRNQTDRLVFIDNIYSLKSTYQFTRFVFARARLDYDSLASSVRGQYLLGWTPNPGTSFYIGYNDDLYYNGFSPFTGHYEPGFRRNGRTFFVKTSYLFRRSI